MKISVIGCGYLGAVHAICMASLGHEVVAVDVDGDRIATLATGTAPFFEPDLPELLASMIKTGRLRFTTDMADVAGSYVHFICVGTPQNTTDLSADTTFIDSAFEQVAGYLSKGDVVVGKSTVPVGTAERVAADLSHTAPGATLVWNPEFLREGRAVEDTFEPDRLVYGVAPGEAGMRAVAVLDEVYLTALSDGVPRLITDLATAQLVKVAANSFLATKISFINAMAELCEATGADVTDLADAIGMDERIGRSFLNAGLGFGGGCLPKDIRAFMARAGELGADQTLSFLREVDAINLRRRVRMVELARELLGGSIIGSKVAVLGAAFKPNSDDTRDSPALDVAQQMSLQGADVTVTDPQALVNSRRAYPDLRYVASVTEAVDGADIVMLLTEWDEYVRLDPETLGTQVRQRHVLDARNVLSPQRWREAGWTYRAPGRPAAANSPALDAGQGFVVD